jgi:8-oxo-dGTP pyrophosphatase MutT (NUDIX family)
VDKFKIFNESKASIFFFTIFKKSKIFQDWICEFEKSECTILSVSLKGLIIKAEQTIHSALIEVIFTAPEGRNLVRSILLRGRAVVILTYYFRNRIPFYLLVKQRRIIDGGYTLEFPSGGCDEGISDLDSAVRELFEETGVSVNPQKMQLLATSMPVCESGFDERVTWFACDLTDESFNCDENLRYGQNSEGESIALSFIDFNTLLKINSFQINVGIYLMIKNGMMNQNQIMSLINHDSY